MSEEETVLLCHRVTEMPVPNARSFTDACRQCGAAIWVAYSSPGNVKRLCLQCGAKLIDANTKLTITKEQIADATEIRQRKPQ
jgi:hypothetical protein